MSRFLYADHAATTALSPRALEAMTPYFRDAYGNPSSLYTFGQQAKSDLDAARAEVARCLNAKPEEIFFTSGGTESDNWALKAVAELRGGKGRHIITSAIEHHAILHTLEHLEKALGFSVTYLPVDSLGRVDPQAVKAAIRPDTILITVMAANNEIGTIEPIAEIGAIAREAGVLFHTDAVQAVGHIPVDVSAWNCDMLSLSGHKFHGPRGVGALYVRRGLRLPPLIHGGGQEKGRRSGTENVAGAVGLAAALREAVDGLEARSVLLAARRDRLIEGLTRLPCSRLTGDPVHRLPGTASFVFEGVEGEALLLHLDAKGICASSGSACSSASLDPSHVLLAIGLPHEVAHGSLRLSLGEENTDEDVDYLLQAVPEVVEYLRNMSPVWDKAQQKPVWNL
ncbi:cysteine desulfurase NifS [Intestinimonas butyriciproducens]|mgnify:FL=1|uniref:Cysteine desulfurase IscS n=1 Tax=Intestinimonas butyriciproducens TaxID=1297617 RepID=A0A2U1CDJ9_9FIRM|nr:cysteine desulfurase NifS [Intestinimonas butyriciproducens]SCJ30202.1 Cysteine desulfurase [uncultured Clostridium sp.]MCI6363704.1 cysteine desulfurase NifS [Intestinimonas butyriciproducens]MCR1905916.1 cysteine desulfurase NifS [Intestinimonas butyriciproducens]MDB7830541.1 cysteine desulfurase NifS [Intestinimonas butyriciproducens]MDY3617323.1 cysteine desulfurase NifS [Intestinimonas butyriciproducens]